MESKMTVHTLLQSNEIYVPSYQRAYSWNSDMTVSGSSSASDKQVSVFLNDILDYIGSERRAHYYLGHFIFEGRDDNSYAIIDGQQRLTTVEICISALLSRIEELNGELDDDELTLKEDILARRTRRHFHTVDYDEPFFTEYVIDAKPFDRELFLSRQTMRQEIAYHKEKIQKAHEELIKTGKVKTSETKDFNYLTYSKNSGYEKEQDKSQKNEKRYIQDLKKHTKIKRKGLELSGQDFRLLQAASSSDSAETKLREFVDLQARNMQNIFLEENPVSDKKDEVPNSIDDYIEIAKKYEAAYNFSSAILYYKKALSYNNDESFSEKEPVIYINLAVCNKKIQDYEEAVRMYEKAYSIYSGVSLKKALQILLNIAQIYNEAYKFDKVKETYERILYSTEENSPETTIKCYLGLSELEDNNLETENALKYAKMALTEAEKYSDVKLLTECYFKYALLLDDNNNLDMAQKYYLRCIQTSANVEENLFLSSAYSNLAGISHEHNNISAAKMYYELAVDADKQTNNYEALYYSYTKLAELNKKDFPQKHYEYLVKALGAAKRFDDISYAVSIYYEIGEYYFTSEDYKRALKSYILAKNLMPSHISEKMQKKINNGINRIKILLGDNEFLKLLNEIKKKK